MEREAREHKNDRINRQRFSAAVEIVLEIIDGSSVDDALRHHAWREAKLPRWQMARLRELQTRVGSLFG